MRQPWKVDEEHVKEQILQEQQAWEVGELAAGHSKPYPLQFWSVGKLLRVLQALQSATNTLETLAQYGITRHSVGSVDQHRSTSQPTTAEAQRVPTTDAVAYSSSRIWITGFLHFGESLDTCDILELCDSNSSLPSFLLDPSPQLVDQLVLIKRWVLVDKAFGGVRTTGSMFLEVHDEKPVILSPVNDPYMNWTQKDVLEVLEINYQTTDPPMYTGTERWITIAARSRDTGDNDVVAARQSDERRTNKKRKRSHVVFGRVTSVSPISRQKDRASSHFFAEIECHQRCTEAATQSVVTVMFTGVENVRWNLFFRPGKIVFLTDLVKVHSRECEIFLLQATHGHQSSHSEKEALETLVLIWNEPSLKNAIVTMISDSLSAYSKEFVSRCTGKLLDFEGRVCRLLWDECIELLGPEGTRVIVCLFHFPYTHELIRLRKGATISISAAHVLRWPTPVGGKLVMGLCPRSHFAITSYGDPSGQCITMGTRSRRGRVHKKWSSLGDFHCQSMVLSMWLLEVLELLDLKFLFGGAKEMNGKAAQLSFPRTRRRQAVSVVAKKLGFSLENGHDQAAMTLGALFLKCHSSSAGNCMTVQLPLREKLLACSRMVTIRELQKAGESKLKWMVESKSEHANAADGVLSIRIPADEFDWCLLLGCIRKNGELEAYDRTGSISLRLGGGETEKDLTGRRGVYLFRNFNIVIEDYTQVQGFQQEERLPLVYCMNCSADNIEFVSIRDDETINYSPEAKAAAESQTPQDLPEVFQVRDLLLHPRTYQSQQSAGNDEEQSIMKTINPDLHKPHLISVIGVITKKKYYWKSNDQQSPRTVGVKRARQGDSNTQSFTRKLACILHVRDLQHPDTIEIRVDTSLFGLLGTLQLNCVVELTRLQGFIARSNFKVYVSWIQLTGARIVPNLTVPRDAELYGLMSTVFLNDLYFSSNIDRMLHRYVVGVVHISYVVLKRKCGLCHQALEFNKRRGVWKHFEQTESKYSRYCTWKWHQMTPSDSAFKTRTYMGTTVRCVIDDGSGQAELFLENDVAWELLTCTAGQRQRFEDILSNYVEELSYFSGRTANGSFATSKAEREQEYYQNELHAFVLNAIPSLRSIVVFAQRFYKAKEKEGMSVLTFGKDIHLTTKTVPQPKLEAKRVDRLHIRSELQQRLAQLRQRIQGTGGATRPCATVEQT
ncbi:hypothetical protein F442_05338 [Phytophthora nicotianae P10297]|uniref:CST complex subunit CTC1 n=2 Tax=Phytophthora nicotianae P10297 TaxID=1317064 RepID=W2ZNR6_PHYNI|nr:hypothetical protein F442_05338 [Phytophthora nicotianae P10297]